MIAQASTNHSQLEPDKGDLGRTADSALSRLRQFSEPELEATRTLPLKASWLAAPPTGHLKLTQLREANPGEKRTRLPAAHEDVTEAVLGLGFKSSSSLSSLASSS